MEGPWCRPKWRVIHSRAPDTGKSPPKRAMILHTSPVTTPESLFDDLCAEPNAVKWTMSAAGAIDYISSEVEGVRGISPEAAMAQSGDQIHPAESLAVSLAYFEGFARDLIEGRVPATFHDHLEYNCADGSTVWCEVVAMPIMNTDGSLQELRGVSAPRSGRPS